MSWASNWLTSSRAFTSMSRNVALGWDAFHAVISPMISSLTSFKLFSSFMFSPLFLFAFQKDDAFTHLSCLPYALWSLAKHSPFYLFFRSLATSPVQKNDVHPPQPFQGCTPLFPMVYSG